MASEWLFTCPDDVLDKLLHGSGPGTPQARDEAADDAPVLAPRRVTLQVGRPSRLSAAESCRAVRTLTTRDLITFKTHLQVGSAV